MSGTTTLGTIVVRGYVVTFPFGQAIGGGGGEPPPNDADDPISEPPVVDDPCHDVSGMSDTEKTKYLIKYLAQQIAALMLAQPVQNREWGSAIYTRPDGSYGFTPLAPTTDHRAVIVWDALPKTNGVPDYGSVVGFIHSHPRLNLYESSPGVWEDDYDYWRSFDPTRLIRPHSGDWLTYADIATNAGSTPTTSDVQLFLLGYTETNGVGRMALTSYDKSQYNGGADTPASGATPELAPMDPPCNESL